MNESFGKKCIERCTSNGITSVNGVCDLGCNRGWNFPWKDLVFWVSTKGDSNLTFDFNFHFYINWHILFTIQSPKAKWKKTNRNIKAFYCKRYSLRNQSNRVLTHGHPLNKHSITSIKHVKCYKQLLKLNT